MTTFTKVHYQAFADALYAERQHIAAIYVDEGTRISTEATVARIALRLQALFERDNPAFDGERFQRSVYRDHEVTPVTGTTSRTVVPL